MQAETLQKLTQANPIEEQSLESYNWETHKFRVPEKLIRTEQDLNSFPERQIYRAYMQFLFDCQEAVTSKAISKTPEDPTFQWLYDYLADLDKLLEQVPPVQQAMRFGNTAFKTYHEKAMEISKSTLQKQLLKSQEEAILELIVYLSDSFGSNMRIDYGTGHEMNFMIFLFVLYRLRYFKKDQLQAMVHTVFYRYIALMRKI